MYEKINTLILKFILSTCKLCFIHKCLVEEVVLDISLLNLHIKKA